MWEVMKAMRGAALQYLALGWSIIPITFREKHPAWALLPQVFDPAKMRNVGKWEEFQHRHVRQSEFEYWFSRSGFINIGIVCGAISGIVVVDCDTLQAYMWARKHLMVHDQTPIASTGAGHHIFFNYPGKHVGNAVGMSGIEGLDIRADGGYVVASPSIHASGRQYQWVIPPDVPLLDLPTWFFEPVQGCDPAPAPVRKTAAGANRDMLVPAMPTGKSFAQASFESLTDQLSRAVAPVGKGKNRASAGNRNMELNRVGYRLGQLIGLGELDRATVVDALRDIARGLGLADREIEATLISGVGDGIRDCDKLRQWRKEKQRQWWNSRMSN
jgi:hypothetical protein